MRSGRLSFFAAASWLVPFFVFLMMRPYVDAATERGRGSLLPGWGAEFTRLDITAGLAFVLGFLSFIRRERLCWAAAIPCFVGGLWVCWFVLLPWLNSGWSAVCATLPAEIIVGILMVLNGVFFLTCLLPRASARLAREQHTDGSGEKDARMTPDAVKLFGIATLIVGVVLILIHPFGLL